jgi:ADP-ribose pyrophosphatase YjhB (NUDIX family)
MSVAQNFCSVCGHALVMRVPDADNRERACCDSCGTIHYQNPRIVVGTLPVWRDQVLLCRRAIEPRHGYWTLPGGFLENDESVGDGAVRETDEEAGARVVLGPLFTMLDVIHVHQVHCFFLAELVDIDFEPGEESLEVRLFDEASIPWDDLAFRTVSMTLRHYFDDRRRGDFALHTGRVDWSHQPEPIIVPALATQAASPAR